MSTARAGVGPTSSRSACLSTARRPLPATCATSCCTLSSSTRGSLPSGTAHAEHSAGSKNTHIASGEAVSCDKPWCSTRTAAGRSAWSAARRASWNTSRSTSGVRPSCAGAEPCASGCAGPGARAAGAVLGASAGAGPARAGAGRCDGAGAGPRARAGAGTAARAHTVVRSVSSTTVRGSGNPAASNLRGGGIARGGLRAATLLTVVRSIASTLPTREVMAPSPRPRPSGRGARAIRR